MARWSGRPDDRSHTTVVSRWLVMPIAATASPASSQARTTSVSVATVAAQISSGSCSTQPGWGKYWGNSRYALRTTELASSIAKVRTPVVPASMPRITRRLSPTAADPSGDGSRAVRMAAHADGARAGELDADRDPHRRRRLPRSQRGDPGHRPQGRLGAGPLDRRVPPGWRGLMDGEV